MKSSILSSGVAQLFCLKILLSDKSRFGLLAKRAISPITKTVFIDKGAFNCREKDGINRIFNFKAALKIALLKEDKGAFNSLKTGDKDRKLKVGIPTFNWDKDRISVKRGAWNKNYARE